MKNRPTPKRLRGCLVLLLVFFVVVVMGYVAAVSVIERNFAETMAKVRKPVSMLAHTRLAAEMAGEEPGLSDEELATLDEDDPFPANAAEIVSDWRALLALVEERTEDSDIDFSDPSEWDASELAHVETFLEENEDLVREIHLMAGRGGPMHVFDFSLGWDGIELPNIAVIWECRHVLQAHAIVESRNGNTKDAVSDITDVLQMSEALVHEPIMVSQFIRIAIVEGAIDTLYRCVQHGGDLSPSQVEELKIMLDRAHNREEVVDALRTEQIMIPGLVRRAAKEWKKDSVPVPVLDWIGKAAVNANMRRYTEAMNELISATKAPYYESLDRLKAIEKITQDASWLNKVATTALPRPVRTCASQARHEAVVDLTRIGIQLERHQAEHGSYPDTLEAIAHRLGGTVPVDPFTGQPFRYLPAEDSFTLYSVSVNLTDDGGRHNPGTGDIVWRGVEEEEPEPVPSTDEHVDDNL